MRGGFRSAMELAVARCLRLDPQRIAAHCGLHIVKLNRQGRIEPGSDGYFFHETRFLSRFDIRSAGHALKPVCCVNVEPHATVSYFLLASPAGDKAGPPGDPQGGGEVVAKGIERERYENNRAPGVAGLGAGLEAYRHPELAQCLDGCGNISPAMSRE